MISRLIGGFGAALAFAPIAAIGQDDPPTGYVYVTYFECNPARESRADEIVTRNFEPHYNAAVEAGDIASWSWLAHFVGGKWRRALVLTATDMDDLLDAAGALGEIIEETTPEAGRVFTEVCTGHEDYIWQTVPGVGNLQIGNARGAVGFSMYMQCDLNQEERADELIGGTLGDVYNRQVEAGNLISWGWLQHNVGGQWRRLLTATSSDHKTMMKAREEIVQEMQSGRAERASRQLNEFCPNHQDYMWDIQIETP